MYCENQGAKWEAKVLSFNNAGMCCSGKWYNEEPLETTCCRRCWDYKAAYEGATENKVVGRKLIQRDA
jgi:hypothetical protein